MKLDEFQRATESELQATAASAFEKAETSNTVHAPAAYAKARFYLGEIERRHDAAIATRDFRMELAIIGLIVLEIIVSVGLALWERRQQLPESRAQQQILS